MLRNQTDHLDKSQREFCGSSADNIRLLAPAGCGKTLALVHRCLHLFERDEKTRPRVLIQPPLLRKPCVDSLHTSFYQSQLRTSRWN